MQSSKSSEDTKVGVHVETPFILTHHILQALNYALADMTRLQCEVWELRKTLREEQENSQKQSSENSDSFNRLMDLRQKVLGLEEEAEVQKEKKEVIRKQRNWMAEILASITQGVPFDSDSNSFRGLTKEGWIDRSWREVKDDN